MHPDCFPGPQGWGFFLLWVWFSRMGCAPSEDRSGRCTLIVSPAPKAGDFFWILVRGRAGAKECLSHLLGKEN